MWSTEAIKNYNVGKRIDKVEAHKNMNLSTREPWVYYWFDADADIETKLDVFDHKYNELIFTLKHRYLNNLSTQQKNNLSWLLQDWTKFGDKKLRNTPTRLAYSPYIFTPHYIEEFIIENKASLRSIWVKIEANAHLLRYEEALRNTYNYVGKKKVFQEVDREFDPYVSWVYWYNTWESVDEINKYNLFEYRCWIKEVSWKNYLLVWNVYAKWFTLAKIEKNPYEIDYTPSKQIVDLIKRWEVNILADQILEYMYDKYIWENLYDSDLKKQIVWILTDLYAQWFECWYLIWPAYKEYKNEKKRLDVFMSIFIWQNLELNEGSRISDIYMNRWDIIYETYTDMISLISDIEYKYWRQWNLLDNEKLKLISLLMQDISWYDNDKGKSYEITETLSLWLKKHDDELKKILQA